MLIPILALALTVSAEPTPTAAGAWRDARWGMTEAEVLAAFPGEAKRLEKPIVFSEKATATLEVPSIDVAGSPYNVTFQFSPATHTLVHIQLKHESPTSAITVMFDDLRKRLIEKFGQPVDHSESDNMRDITWFQGNTEIQLVIIDIKAGSKSLMRAILINYSQRTSGGTKNL